MEYPHMLVVRREGGLCYFLLNNEEEEKEAHEEGDTIVGRFSLHMDESFSDLYEASRAFDRCVGTGEYTFAQLFEVMFRAGHKAIGESK